MIDSFLMEKMDAGVALGNSQSSPEDQKKKILRVSTRHVEFHHRALEHALSILEEGNNFKTVREISSFRIENG